MIEAGSLRKTYARVQTVPKGKTKTKQSMATDCDINNIMKKFQKTGTLDHVAKHGGTYEYATALTYQEAIHVKRDAEEMFNDLPSSLRTKFKGNPAIFLDFVQNDDNLEEMGELGLLNEQAETRLKGIREAKAIAAEPQTPEGGEGVDT